MRTRLVGSDGVLTAPGILQNPVPVRALVDPDASNAATLRNLLNRAGYASLDDVKAQSEARGLRQAVLDLCELLGIEVTPARRAHLEGLDLPGVEALRVDLKRRRAWPA